MTDHEDRGTLPLGDEPTAIELDRDSMELRLAFADGGAGTIGLVELRLACPCATCRGLRGAGGASWPRPGAPEPLSVVDASLVGAWGLSVAWNDGHATGIYPFSSLRRWIDAGHPDFPPDSGLGG